MNKVGERKVRGIIFMLSPLKFKNSGLYEKHVLVKEI